MIQIDVATNKICVPFRQGGRLGVSYTGRIVTPPIQDPDRRRRFKNLPATLLRGSCLWVDLSLGGECGGVE